MPIGLAASEIDGRRIRGPPRSPRFTSIKPSASRMRSASRTVGLEYPRSVVRSFSDGSGSPGKKSPLAIRRRSSAAIIIDAFNASSPLRPLHPLDLLNPLDSAPLPDRRPLLDERQRALFGILAAEHRRLHLRLHRPH